MLKREDTALVLIDIQGKLAQLMQGKEALFQNLVKLVRGAQILEVAEFAFDRFAFSVAAQIVTENAKALREMRKFVIPLAIVGHASMDHHEGLPLPRNLVVNASIVNCCQAKVDSYPVYLTPPQPK